MILMLMLLQIHLNQLLKIIKMVDVAVLTGYGINCDDETKFAFENAGARTDLVHVNDVIDSSRKLKDYQILTIPGGFSYGDDTGAGNAMANRIRNNLKGELSEFVSSDKLVIGICNGFQVIANLGLVPAIDRDYGKQRVALVYNKFPRYNCRWTDLEFSGDSPWLKGLQFASMPIAHEEGGFHTDDETLQTLKEKGLVAVRYVKGFYSRTHDLSVNPNGSLDDIAGITDETGRILGMMPHPERAIEYTQLPDWTLLADSLKRTGRSPDELAKVTLGLKIFENGVKYFG